jgi:hypothetical protein
VFHIDSTRLVLIITGAVLLEGTLFFFLQAVDSSGRLTRGVLFVVFVASVLTMTAEVQRPPIMHVDERSTNLWSMTLVSPDYALKRVLPYPLNSPSRLRLAVKLATPYQGSSWLSAVVNGRPYNRLLPAGTIRTFRYPDVDLYVHETLISAVELPPTEPVEVVITQARPDPSLRIAVWGSLDATKYTGDSAWFRFGTEWVRGTPRSSTGAVVDAFPIIWIEGAD